MPTWTATLPALAELDDLARRVDADDNVRAVLLTGSHAHGMPTADCDLDLHVILERPDEAWQPGNRGSIDLAVTDVRRFRRIPTHPANWWDRYRVARGRLLLDRSDGEIETALQSWGRLTDAEQVDAIDYYLDPYLTYSSRSLHEFGVGESKLAHLDAVEALPWALRVTFALQNRIRPTNRYLEWELRNHPLTGPGDVPEPEWLLQIVDEVRVDGSPDAQRRLFAVIEPQLRRRGFGGALDGYPKALHYLRG